MLFALSSLTAAIAHELGDFFADKVPRIYRAVTGVEPRDDTQLTAMDAGKILALLLVPDTVTACGPKGPDLSEVMLELGAREVWFPAERAKDHKLFGPWVGSTLAESLALAFAASADLSIAAASAPVAMAWEVGGIGDALSAECTMQFATTMGEQAVVVATYGATEAPAGLLTTRKLCGAQLARVAAFACDLTRATNAEAATAPDADAGAATFH